ncbi:hypothetical protein OAK87_01355 [bacterium]|nr:hypothetical protein [bacterium]
MSVDNLFNESQIEQLKQGIQISGSVRDGLTQATSFSPTQTIPITGAQKNLQARMKDADGNPIEKRVSAPNTSKYNKLNAERKLAELDAQEAAAKESETLDPSKLLATMNAIDRRLRKIEKQLKETAK